VPSLFDLAKLLTGRSDSCGCWPLARRRAAPTTQPRSAGAATPDGRRRRPFCRPDAAHVPCSRDDNDAGPVHPDQDEVA
jgi:hypothetical protein